MRRALVLSLCLSLLAGVVGACSDDSDDNGSSSSDGGSNDGGQPNVGGMAAGGAAGGLGGEGGLGGSGGVGGSGGEDPCADPLPIMQTPPTLLSATDLYSDIASKQIAAHARIYQSRFPLWSDDASKRRWAYLPCEQINSDDMDDWSFPVGTRFWKEFRIGNQLIETRLLHRFGPGPNDFFMTSYEWDPLQNDATRVQFGVVDAQGTTHNIPSELECKRCHGGLGAGTGGRPSRVLGFSAMQLAHTESGVTLTTLNAEQLLTMPGPTTVSPPGDNVAQAALGYLHSNCGTCHNDSVDGLVNTAFNSWLSTSDASVETTQAYLTGVNQPTVTYMAPGCSTIITPGAPLSSCVITRMNSRAAGVAMPPLGTEVVDDTGLAAVTAWIQALP